MKGFSFISNSLLAISTFLNISGQHQFQHVDAASTVPSAQLEDGSLITGTILSSGIEAFKGIPYATPPLGNLRFKPPQPYNKSLNGFQATEFSSQCYMESPISLSETNLPQEVITLIENNPFFGGLDSDLSFSEDCLTIAVYRPPGTTQGDNLPVMFWIYGGGFAFGSIDLYDPSLLLQESINMNQPVIFVAINYRVGAYGFLGGSEIVQEGSGNAGLLDQRLGLQWVADNIVGFGGNPNDVTILGESAGSISVAHQMLLYNGNYTYKGNPLFHGAIMESGSLLPVGSLDSSYPQSIFNQLASSAGCGSATDKLECLRTISSDDLNAAQNTLPSIFGYHTLGLSFLPRFDGNVITDQPYSLVTQGKYAKVPFIIGDQQDEGTIFALVLANITTNSEALAYVKFLLPNITDAELLTAAQLYPNIPSDGSPFNTGSLNEFYPEYKRLAAVLGDIAFQWPRRFFLQNAEVDSYSFLATSLSGMPIVGTMHATDLLFLFYVDDDLTVSGTAYRQHWVAFANHKDPNIGVTDSLTTWPLYSNGQNNLVIGELTTSVAPDNYRQLASEWINSHLSSLMF